MQSQTKQILKQQKHKFLIRHVWWIDTLLFIIGTILLGGLATLLGGKMFNFQNYNMPPYTVPKIVFPIAWGLIYIAIGISGAVHHIVGMQQSGTVIAINPDKDAPIFDYADYGIIAKIEEIEF